MSFEPTTDRERLSVSTIDSLSRVSREEWDRLLPAHATGTPFVRWDFLKSLEDARCVGDETGWTPCHVTVRTSEGALVGAAPLYIKSHSMGEYVFDHSWAEALGRAGFAYYPKLQCASPFTPVPGPRLLAVQGAVHTREEIQQLLVRSITALATSARMSSFHMTFHGEEERQLAARALLLARTGVQFHFANNGYASFDDFLSTLASSRRKNLRKERERAKEGRTIVCLEGDRIREEDWDFFFRCYLDTGSRKWGTPYLNRRFFQLLAERMGPSCVLFVASENGARVASALNVVDATTLYGRYWGCVADVPFLHFELCYYQAMDFAIARGLPRVEAGAQGEHKLLRGYAPVPTYSSHWVAHPGLRSAISDYLARETPEVARDIDELSHHTPYKKLPER